MPGQVLEAVLNAQDAIQLLILGKDYTSAIELLDKLKFRCEQQGLCSLRCLQRLPDSLSQIIRSLTSSLEEDFGELTQWKMPPGVSEETVSDDTQERGVEGV